MRSLRAVRLLAFAALAHTTASAQGPFVNFEAPSVKPITVAKVGNQNFLLVCNAADNSVEIYDVEDHAFVTRVGVGQHPVTVRWNPALRSFYTCNFVGDSITRVQLTIGSNQQLEAKVLVTNYVGDEPSDLVFLPDQWSMLITLNTKCALSWVDSIQMLPFMGAAGLDIKLTWPILNRNATLAMKEPRRIVLQDNRLITFGTRGGNRPTYDFDFLAIDFTTGRQVAQGGLGSMNFGVAVASDGRLFVTGTMARNELPDEAAVRQAPSGFVESHLYVVRGAGTTQTIIEDRDLNRTATGAVVSPSQATSHPTDVVLYEQAGSVRKVFYAAFHSDRIGVLAATTGAPSTWARSVINLPLPSGDYRMVGPRGLVLKPADSSIPRDPGPRLYVLNTLSASITVIDPDNERVLDRFSLRNDPTPTVIRAGRASLYSAKLSGNGFVSCASCHADGGTDGLTWRLGGGSPVPIPSTLLDGADASGVGNQFLPDKGPLVTQSLHGLVNHVVNPESQRLYANQPYHWRGDRPGLEDFNGAFASLLGGRPLPASDLAVFRDFLNTCVYMPNPDQPLDRKHSGLAGSPDLEDGSGALRGQKLFHTRELPGGVTGGRSCVQCHSGVSGSNDRITEVFDQPLLTAATRSLSSREARLDLYPLATTMFSPTRNGEFGLSHTGLLHQSLNTFMFVFSPAFPGNEIVKLHDMTEYMHQFDAGVAPIVGRSLTVNAWNRSAPQTVSMLALLEGQVRAANAGLSAQLRLNSVTRGFWFDTSVSPPVYRREGLPAESLSLSQILSGLTTIDDVLILQATPAGSERRLASLTGVAAVLRGVAPAQITLEPMSVSSHWQQVPGLTKNWKSGTAAPDFVWSGPPALEPIFLKTLRVYQHALTRQAPQLGLTRLRHEAPRRMRVAGVNIRPGAKLVLQFSKDPNQRPPLPLLPNLVQRLELPIFPTTELTGNQRRIWETTAELDPIHVYALMLGGYSAPGVQAAYDGLVAEPPPASAFDLRWNLFHTSVKNEDGSEGSAPQWQVLKLQ